MYSVDDIDAFMTIMVIIDDNTFLVVDSNYLEIIIPLDRGITITMI